MANMHVSDTRMGLSTPNAFTRQRPTQQKRSSSNGHHCFAQQATHHHCKHQRRVLRYSHPRPSVCASFWVLTFGPEHPGTKANVYGCFRVTSTAQVRRCALILALAASPACTARATGSDLLMGGCTTRTNIKWCDSRLHQASRRPPPTQRTKKIVTNTMSAK